MVAIGIRKFRDRLTAHLRELKRGVSFLLTSRGRPIAVLRAARPEDLAPEEPEKTLEVLGSEGKIRRKKGTISTRVLRTRRKGTPLSRIVSASRR